MMGHPSERRDFSVNLRSLGIAAAAALIGLLSTFAAYCLLGLIHLFYIVR
jgi:hypothetical protein